jgi:hypothetical protein
MNAKHLAELLAAAKAYRETLPLAERSISDLNAAIKHAEWELEGHEVTVEA